MDDSITRLYRTAKACRHDDPSTSRTGRLLRSGRGKIAKKFAEEAIEVVIETVQGSRDALVKESADLIYNLVILWISTDIHPDAVRKEVGTPPTATWFCRERTQEAAASWSKESEPPRASSTRQCEAAAKPSARLALELTR